MGNGDLVVIQADTRRLTATLHLGPAGTHQAKASPDGSVLLAAQVPTQALMKLAAEEGHQRWSVVGSLSFAQLHVAPVCSVSATTASAPTCRSTRPVLRSSPDGKSVIIASSGGGGHIYRLDTASDRLDDLGALGASDWQGVASWP